MSNYSNILAQIKTYIEAVDTTAKVYDYPRYVDDNATQRALFKDTNDKFHTWWIERTAAPNIGHSYLDMDWMHEFTLWGFYEVDDSAASEKTFQGLIDAVIEKFTTEYTNNNTADLIETPTLEAKDDVILAGVLVHRAIIILLINEEKDLST